MKKIFLLLLCSILIFSSSGCNRKTSDAKDRRILDAIGTLSDYWSNTYYEKENIDDKYLEIINTQIINIKDDIDEDISKSDMFKDIDYIVEFDLISNYFDTSPYYNNMCIDNCVIVYKDGSSKVGRNPLNIYRSTTFSNDFSPFIESVEKFHGDYDQIIISGNENE